MPPKLFAGGEDERLHGLGRVEVAQVAAEHLEGEGDLPWLFNIGDFDVCDYCDGVKGDLPWLHNIGDCDFCDDWKTTAKSFPLKWQKKTKQIKMFLRHTKINK